ncbi:MAG: phage tail assembly protein [Synergistaceae bacterium]|jgi:hypothetical protein|nr:phage tail assembly protein [Synergistaceae bacterium]
MYVKFKVPFNFEGEEHEGVELDFDRLTGDDIEKAVEILAAEKRPMGNSLPEFSKPFCAQMAAIAAKKPVEFIRGLPVREYVKVTIEAQNFLLDGVSEVGSTQPTQ